MSEAWDPVCEDTSRRRADVRAHPDPLVNGIDFLEVDAADHRLLHLFFLKPIPPADATDPNDADDAYGLSVDPSRVQITGGVRVVGLEVVAVTRAPDGHLIVELDRRGDFSRYVLDIEADPLDAKLRRTPIDFSAPCPVDFDCRHEPVCPPHEIAEPRLDYLAKDYASFRQLMLDLLPQLNPAFVERNPADLGIALVELMAYVGDHLSYAQDAAANEAFLETARHRISARRHARLVDYRMHDGRNAWTWIHVTVTAPGTLALATKVITQIWEPLRGQPAPPGVVLDDGLVSAESLEADPALAAAVVFETAHAPALHPSNNEIFLHTWGDEECCLAPGARDFVLYSVNQATGVASRPALAAGDFVLIEEVLGPVTAVAGDADAKHRQVMQIEGDPEVGSDPLYREVLAPDAAGRRILLQPNAGAGPGLPLLGIRVRREDALAFPACLSVRTPTEDLIRHVSVARGNLVLADHGITCEDRFDLRDLPHGRPLEAGARFRLRLRRGPLTLHCEPLEMHYDSATARPLSERGRLECPPEQARPAIAVIVSSPSGDDLFTPVPDLLDSPPSEEQFVAEVDDDGRAILRFGDGGYGREPIGANELLAVYRVGNGRAGNVGAEALRHVAVPGGIAGFVAAVRNPLAADGGVDAETIEEVRRFAPQAFWSRQLRAVTEDDYRALAEEMPEVASAVATFRWTGSWLTVFVGIDPADPADLEQTGKGLARLSKQLERNVRARLNRFRIAGYDLEIRPPTFVPLEVDLDVCVSRDHFRSEVARAVADALSNRSLPGGVRGFFHPDHFGFGDDVYLSRLIATVEEVEGVDSVVARRFQRFGELDHGELARGVLPIGPWEIARLDDDANFMENGVLRIRALGGKG